MKGWPRHLNLHPLLSGLLGLCLGMTALAGPDRTENAPLPASLPTLQEEPIQILCLNMHLSSLNWTLKLFNGMQQQLSKLTGRPVEIHIEKPSISDSITPGEIEAFQMLFKERYRDSIDFVVVWGPHKNTLEVLNAIPDVPVIMPSRYYRGPEDLFTPPPNMYVQFCHLNPERDAEPIQQCLPDTQNIVVIAGVDSMSRMLLENTREKLGKSWHGMKVEYWVGRPLAELVTRLAELPDHHAVLFLTQFLDETGAATTSRHVARDISSASRVPVFGLADNFMSKGSGIVGGYVQSSGQVGRDAATIMAQLFKGETVDSASVNRDYGSYQFDWLQMRRWGIPESRLPEGAVMLNRPAAFIERHLMAVRVAGIVILSIMILLFVLLLMQRQRARYLRHLVEHQQREVDLKQRYASILGTTTDAVVLCDTSGITQLFNRGAERLFGLAEQDAIGSHLSRFCPDDLKASQAEQLQRLQHEGAMQAIETECLTADGRRLPVEININLCRGEDGRPIGIVSVVRDISDRRKAGQALRESEEQFRRLAENTLDVIWTMNLDAVFTYVNPSIIHLTGHTPKEWIGTALFTHADEENSRKMASFIAHEVSKGLASTGVVFETQLRKKTGEPVDVEIHGNINFDEKGTPLFLQGITRDITERKRAEAEIRKFKTISDQANYGMAITDMTGNILYINEYFSRIHGFTAKELLGKNLTRFHSPPQLKDVGHINKSLQQTGSYGPLEVWHMHRDGTEFPMLMNGMLLTDESGTPEFMAATAIDLTGQKQTEEEKTSLEQQLLHSQKMEAVGRLAGGVAHDFNNMLTGIMGYVELSRNEDSVQPKVRGFLNEIMAGAERSADLTRQLLAFASKQTIAPKILDLNEAVAGMLKMLHRLIGEDIDLVWTPGEEVGPVKMDPSQMDQLLANLCVNARDAISGTGRLEIQTESISIDESSCAEIPGGRPGHFIRLTVHDDGCGMDRETLDHVFEPFYTTKPLGEGTGLGLATVYGILNQNNGFVNVSSDPGRGTTFRIYLPRCELKTEPATERAPITERRGGTETILVVEDEQSVRNTILLSLKSLGYTVIEAASPEEAMQTTQQQPGQIDLLLTDVVMPGMNGQDLAKKLTADQPKLHVLYMSGYTADVIANRGTLDEGTHFVSKPMHLNDLAQKVREAIEGPTEKA